MPSDLRCLHGPSRDLHCVKVARKSHFIDGKGLINRLNRQNRHYRRYLPRKCRKLFVDLTDLAWAGRGGTAPLLHFRTALPI